MATIGRECLGLACEYAVATELCRRNIYAQLTLGHRKRTDILAETPQGKMLRLEVKGKQGRDWPNCKGIHGENTVLVLVDFEGKNQGEDENNWDRPDFYVLTVADWLAFLNVAAKDVIATGLAYIDKENVLTWPGQSKNGRPYRGCGITSGQVQTYRDRWDSITGPTQ